MGAAGVVAIVVTIVSNETVGVATVHEQTPTVLVEFAGMLYQYHD